MGVLGVGFINDAYHLPSFREIPEVEVSTVYGKSEDKTGAFAKKWGIPNFYYGDSGLEAICKDDSVDVIDVGLPNFLHLTAVLAAAEHHKAVICEKPLGRTTVEAKRMLDAVERYNVIHCYAENQIFMPKTQYVVELLKRDTIGKIISLRAREAHSGPHSAWFKQKAQSGGGVLLDMGCHTIELGRHLIQKQPKDVAAWTSTLHHKIDVEDNCVVLVRYADEELGQSENSWSAKGGLDVRFEIFGTEGTIFVDLTRETGLKVFTTGSGGSIVEKADSPSGWLFPSLREHETYGFVDELRHFTQCIATSKEPVETFRDGVIVNSIVDAAYEAAASRKWVTPIH